MANDIRIVDTNDMLLFLGIDCDGDDSREFKIAEKSIQFAESAIRRHLRYDPVSTSRVEYYPLQDLTHYGKYVWEVNDNEAYQRHLAEASSNELQLRHIPIRSISELKVDYDGRFAQRSGSFGSDTVWTEGIDFWAQYDSQDSSGNQIAKDGILRSHGRWPTTPGTVKVTYTAGYTAAELQGTDATIDAQPIYEAVLDEAVRRFLKVYSRRKTRAGFAGPLASENLGDYSYSVDTSQRQGLYVGGVSLDNQENIAEFVNYGFVM